MEVQNARNPVFQTSIIWTEETLNNFFRAEYLLKELFKKVILNKTSFFHEIQVYEFLFFSE